MPLLLWALSLLAMRTCWAEAFSRRSDCQELLIPNLCETSVNFFLPHLGLCLDWGSSKHPENNALPQHAQILLFFFFYLTESYTKYFKCSTISQVCLLFAKMIPSMFMKIPTVTYWHLVCNNVLHISIFFLVLEGLPKFLQQSNQRSPDCLYKRWIPTTQNSVCHGRFNKY